MLSGAGSRSPTPSPRSHDKTRSGERPRPCRDFLVKRQNTGGKNADIRSSGRKSRNGKIAVKGIGSKRRTPKRRSFPRLRFPRSDFGLHTAGFPRRTFPADGKPTVLLSRFPPFAHRPAPPPVTTARTDPTPGKVPPAYSPPFVPVRKTRPRPAIRTQRRRTAPSRPRTPDRQASGRSENPFPDPTAENTKMAVLLRRRPSFVRSFRFRGAGSLSDPASGAPANFCPGTGQRSAI